MMEHDPLHQVLQEWRPPEPPPPLDERVFAAFRRRRRPALWWRVWSARISVPVPVLAALLLVIAAAVLEWRPAPQPRAPAVQVTRLESAGFQPLPHGEARVVKIGEEQQ